MITFVPIEGNVDVVFEAEGVDVVTCGEEEAVAALAGDEKTIGAAEVLAEVVVDTSIACTFGFLAFELSPLPLGISFLFAVLVLVAGGGSFFYALGTIFLSFPFSANDTYSSLSMSFAISCSSTLITSKG